MTIKLINPVTIPKTNAPSSDADYLTFKPWTKNGVTRIYINDYKRRTIGYINEDGSSVISDNQGNTTEQINAAINCFLDSLMESEEDDENIITGVELSNAEHLTGGKWILRIYRSIAGQRTKRTLHPVISKDTITNELYFDADTKELTEELHAFWTAHDVDKQITIYSDGIYIKWGELK